MLLVLDWYFHVLGIRTSTTLLEACSMRVLVAVLQARAHMLNLDIAYHVVRTLLVHCSTSASTFSMPTYDSFGLPGASTHGTLQGMLHTHARFS